jgi:hypothetical protein
VNGGFLSFPCLTWIGRSNEYARYSECDAGNLLSLPLHDLKENLYLENGHDCHRSTESANLYALIQPVCSCSERQLYYLKNSPPSLIVLGDRSCSDPLSQSRWGVQWRTGRKRNPLVLLAPPNDAPGNHRRFGALGTALEAVVPRRLSFGDPGASQKFGGRSPVGWGQALRNSNWKCTFGFISCRGPSENCAPKVIQDQWRATGQCLLEPPAM